MAMKDKKFRDPIHGFITVSPAERKVIDSLVFQRTRNIKQLSLGHYVYHGAEHSRFGHMIGAAHIAGRAFDSLRWNADALGEDFQADETDRATLRMAALLHDIGHTPFSHALEKVLGPDHEKYSQALVKACFEDVLEKEGIDVKTVNNLIVGDPYPGKPYLSRIISGQLDVDRLDYLLRDSYYSGVSYGQYDLDRIIAQLAVVGNKLVVLDGGYEAVEQMIFARYQMYQQVYFHKTKSAFELMLHKCGEVLKDDLGYPKPNELEGRSGIGEYVGCDDRWFLNSIFQSDDSRVKTIAAMIKSRRPYRMVYSPVTDRNKTSQVKLEPYDSSGRLETIQTALLNSLEDLGIEEHEFLPDESRRRIYKLMPDYPLSDRDDEGDSVSIYYKNHQYTEPIEKRSRIVYTFGTIQTSLIRGFAIPDKYDRIKDYIEHTFSRTPPEH